MTARFEGMSLVTMDDKGRVTLPLPFARQAPAWVAVEADRCLLVVPGDRCGVPSVAARRATFRVLPYRRTGRFGIPLLARNRLRFRPGFDVLCVGMGAWIEYWNPARYSLENALPLKAARDLAGQIRADAAGRNELKTLAGMEMR